MLRQFSTRRVVAFILFDWLGTLAALVIASYVRVWVGVVPGSVADFFQTLDIPVNLWPIAAPADVLLPQLFLLVTLIWPFFFFVFRVYDGRFSSTMREELLNVLLAILAATLTLAGVLYFTYQDTSRILFIAFFWFDCLTLLGARLSLRLLRKRQHRSAQRTTTIIVGAGRVGCRAAMELQKYAQERVNLVGFVDDDPDKQATEFGGLPILGTLDDVPSIVQMNNVRDAVIALPLHAHQRLVDVCNQLQKLGVHVHVIPDLFALSFPSAALDGFGGIPVLDLGQPGIFGWRRAIKRLFDVITTSMILVIVWPLILAIAVAVKLDSPGPILFRQKRIGEHGHAFEMLKFRSMRINNDDRVHREHMARLITENVTLIDAAGQGKSSLKLQHDPRITRVGTFIRKTSLDELPQLLNVLRGEMSLVGPRPPVPYEVELYKDWHRRRFDAIPGLTGMWQVHGRNRVSFDEMVRMDIEYIDRQSLWLDIRLLLKTPFALISGHGAG